MGTFNAAILPATPGLALGSPSQPWSITASTLDVIGTQTIGGVVSNTTNPASSGLVRAANADAINFRNAANTADVNGLSISPSNIVAVGGSSGISLSGPLQSNLRAGTSGQVTLLNFQTAKALTGNGVEQTIYTYTLPGGTMLANQGISVRVGWKHTSGVASVSYSMYFGGSSSNISSADTSFNLAEYECFNTSVVTGQVMQEWQSVGASASSFASNFLSPAENTAAAVIIKFTFNVANTDTVQGNYFRVMLIN